jgi:ferredoxin-type protein NapH
MVAMTLPPAGSRLKALARRRTWVQALFLLVWLDPLLLRMHTVCGPVFHCYSCPLAFFACPIGVLANFSALHLFPYLAVGTLALVGGVFGTFVCGWACPFGFLQDLIGKIPLPKFTLPGWTGYGRYAVLAGMVIVVPFLYGEGHALFFCRLCPAGALEGAIPNTVKLARAGAEYTWPSTLKLAILGAVLVAALIKYRPWCSLLCPLGAIFGACNRVSLLALRYQVGSCRSCGACEKMCRYGVLPSRDLNNERCIRCLECTKCNAIAGATAFSLPADGPRGPKDRPPPTTSVTAHEAD